MKQAFFALKEGDWEECKNLFKVQATATEWAFERIREAFEKVAKDEAGKLSIVPRMMLKSTDYLRRIIGPAGRARRCHVVISVPAMQPFSPGRLRLMGSVAKSTGAGGANR